MAEELLWQYRLSRNIDHLAVLMIAIDIDKYGPMIASTLSGHVSQWSLNVRKAIGTSVHTFLMKYCNTTFTINASGQISLVIQPFTIAETNNNWISIVHLCSLLHEYEAVGVQLLKDLIDSSPITVYRILKSIKENLEHFLSSHADVFNYDYNTQLVQIAWIKKVVECSNKTKANIINFEENSNKTKVKINKVVEASNKTKVNMNTAVESSSKSKVKEVECSNTTKATSSDKSNKELNSLKKNSALSTDSISIKKVNKIDSETSSEKNFCSQTQSAKLSDCKAETPTAIDDITTLCYEALAVEYFLMLLERNNNTLKLPFLLRMVTNAPVVVKQVVKMTAVDVVKFLRRFPAIFIYIKSKERVACINTDQWVPKVKELHGLRYLASLLHYKGPLKILNFLGCLGNSSNATRSSVGYNKADVEKFINLHMSYFNCNEGVIQVNTNTLWQVFIGFCTASKFLRSKRKSIDVYGEIMYLHDRMGRVAINGRPNVLAHFHMNDCFLEVADSERSALKLNDFMSVGEKVVFDIVEASSSKAAQYQALRVRKNNFGVTLPLLREVVNIHDDVDSNSVYSASNQSFNDTDTEFSNYNESESFCKDNSTILQDEELVDVCGQIIFLFGQIGRIAIEGILNDTAFFHINNCEFNEFGNVGPKLGFLCLGDTVVFDLIMEQDKADRYEAVRVRRMMENSKEAIIWQHLSENSSSAASIPCSMSSIYSNNVAGTENEHQLVACCKEILCIEHFHCILHKNGKKLSMTKLSQLLSTCTIALPLLKSLAESSMDYFRWFLRRQDCYFKYYCEIDEVESFEYLLKDWSMAKFLIYVIKVLSSLIVIYGFTSPVTFADRVSGCSSPVLEWLGGTHESDVLYFFERHPDYFKLDANNAVTVKKDNLRKLFDCEAEKTVQEAMGETLTSAFNATKKAKDSCQSKTRIRTRRGKKNNGATLADKSTGNESEVTADKYLTVEGYTSSQIANNNLGIDFHLKSMSGQETLCNSVPADNVHLNQNFHSLKVDPALGLDKNGSINNLVLTNASEGLEEVIDMLKVIVLNANSKSLASILTEMLPNSLLITKIGSTEADLMSFINKHSNHFQYCNLRKIVLSLDVMLNDSEKEQNYGIQFLKAFLKRCGKMGYKAIARRTKTASKTIQKVVGTTKDSVANFIQKHCSIFSVTSGIVCLIDSSLVSKDKSELFKDSLPATLEIKTTNESDISLTLLPSCEAITPSCEATPSSFKLIPPSCELISSPCTIPLPCEAIPPSSEAVLYSDDLSISLDVLACQSVPSSCETFLQSCSNVTTCSQNILHKPLPFGFLDPSYSFSDSQMQSKHLSNFVSDLQNHKQNFEPSSLISGTVVEIQSMHAVTLTSVNNIMFSISALKLREKCRCGDLRNHLFCGMQVSLCALVTSANGVVYSNEVFINENFDENKCLTSAFTLHNDYYDMPEDFVSRLWHNHDERATEVNKVVCALGKVCVRHRNLVCLVFGNEHHGLFESLSDNISILDEYALNCFVGFNAERGVLYSADWKINKIWPFTSHILC